MNPESPGKLTPAEKDVIKQVAAGLTNYEIGQLLEITEATVKCHLTHIYRKYEVRNRVEAVNEYRRRRAAK